MTFSEVEKKQIVSAIKLAEKETSGEIRVHVEGKCADNDPVARAVFLFKKLEMDKTAARNGVLIYIAENDRKFSIVGDEGIHKVVGDDFWNEAAGIMRSKFAQQKMAEGICAAIELTGEKLKKYFPFQNADQNELSDEISEA